MQRVFTHPIQGFVDAGVFCRSLTIWIVMLLYSGVLSGGTSLAQENSAATKTADEQATLDKVRQLIRQLEADQLAQRDEAEAELVKLGSVVLKFLPSITPQTSGEMKVRLQRIRQELQNIDIETHFEPSKVTLQGSMKLSEVLSKIKEQTGNVVEVQGGPDGGQATVTVDWQEVTFWTAIDDLMRQTKMHLVAFGTTESHLVVAPGYYSELSPYVTGPFRVDASGVQSERTFGSQLDGFTRVSFLFSWEPRLEPVFMQIPMSSVKAVTADGQEILATNPQAAPEVRLNIGGSSAQVDLQLNRIDRKHQQLESIKGQLVVSVPGERHQYQFGKLGTGKRQSERFGDVAVTLEGSQRNGRVYEMRLFVEFGDSQGALESYRGWILSNRAYILDANDKQLENVGFQTYGANDKGVGISYMFQLNNDPDSYKLIYESPSSIRRQTIDYELRNIPLP